ncbi:zinc finger protein 271-like isoform X1 [Syngnathus typhle]|uniref:zinc finger protein 271-like isoform X1 n=1 Tax=Syngnathus typhle TaxID=161592 RepID=UPI002A69E6A1|nr:zinc finger protein 271-like isoform X1 [Syngnathus typhle]
MDTGVQLPLSALRLLVSPVKLVSAAIWQIIDQRVVSDYEMVEDFVCMVTDVVPEVITDCQRTQLILGLRAQMILELCHLEGKTHFNDVEQHLDRMKVYNEKSFAESDNPCSTFVDFVKHLLNDPAEKEHFFTEVFPKEFGPSYDKALKSLVEVFLCRLEKFLSEQTFQQVASTCSEVSSVLGDSLKTMRSCDALTNLLQYHKGHSLLEPHDIFSDSTYIMSALKCAAVKGHSSQETPSSSPCKEATTGNRTEEDMPVNTRVSSPMEASPHCSDSKDVGSEESSWSFYSNENSLSSPSSWFDNSGEEVLDVDSSSQLLNEATPVTNQEKASRKRRASKKRVPPKKSGQVKSPTSKSQVKCFICNERVSTKLRTHVRSHFPDGQYTCPHCNSKFKLLSSLKTHIVKRCYDHAQQREDPEPGQELYKCDHCEKAFEFSLSLEAHKRTHNQLYCAVCRKVLKDAATLERHKASHTEFQCTRCEKTFVLFKPLRKHYQHFHKVGRPFQCIHCSQTFSRLEYMIRHEWRHAGHLPLKCSICAMGFRNDCDLVSHQRVHTKEKPYLCGDCGKTFSQRTNLLRHHRFVHSEEKDKKKHFCAECQTYFKEKGALLQHNKRKHIDQCTRRCLCPYCGKSISVSSIARHKLLHTGERPLQCNANGCNKTFLTATEQKKHFLTHHSTERPFKCDTCGKGFISVGLRNAHARLHSGQKPFVCDICIKAFSRRHTLNRHKKLVHAFSI